MLYRRLSRFNIYVYHSTQTFVLHRQSDCSVCEHLRSCCAGLSLAVGQSKEDHAVGLDSRCAARLLSLADRIDSTDIVSHSSTRQISPVYSGSCQSLHRDHDHHIEYSFSSSVHGSSGPLAEKPSLNSFAETSLDATTGNSCSTCHFSSTIPVDGRRRAIVALPVDSETNCGTHHLHRWTNRKHQKGERSKSGRLTTRTNARWFVQIVEEWRFIALILDRIFLIIFVSISLIGTLGSLLKAPSLYQSSPPVDPMCYVYYPPINDSYWMKKCARDYFSSISNPSMLSWNGPFFSFFLFHALKINEERQLSLKWTHSPWQREENRLANDYCSFLDEESLNTRSMDVRCFLRRRHRHRCEDNSNRRNAASNSRSTSSTIHLLDLDRWDRLERRRRAIPHVWALHCWYKSVSLHLIFSTTGEETSACRSRDSSFHVYYPCNHIMHTSVQSEPSQSEWNHPDEDSLKKERTLVSLERKSPKTMMMVVTRRDDQQGEKQGEFFLVEFQRIEIRVNLLHIHSDVFDEGK